MAKMNSPTQKALLAKYLSDNKIEPPKKEVIECVIIDEKPINIGLSGLKDFGIYIDSINNCAMGITLDDKHVIENIIHHYEYILNELLNETSQPFESIKDFMRSQCVDQGICRYSRVVLGVAIAELWWVKQYNGDSFWFPVPGCCENIHELLDSISKRLDRLTEILNSIQ